MLLHVALDFPRELDVVTDVEVHAEVHELANAAVVERVKTLHDHDVGRLDLLRGVEGAVDVVVDRLLDGLAGLEGGELLEHEVEVVLGAVQRGALRHLAAFAVVQVVVVKADDGHVVRDEGVGLPATAVEAAPERPNIGATEVLDKPPHEGALAAARPMSTIGSSLSPRAIDGTVDAACLRRKVGVRRTVNASATERSASARTRNRAMTKAWRG